MPDRRFRIAQCLCGPERHAILAMPVEEPVDEVSNADVLAKLRAAVEQMLADTSELDVRVPRINPWCGLCGRRAAKWVYEVGASRLFADWDALVAELRRLEGEQMETSAVLGLLDLSFDAQLRRAASGSERPQ